MSTTRRIVVVFFFLTGVLHAGGAGDAAARSSYAKHTVYFEPLADGVTFVARTGAFHIRLTPDGADIQHVKMRLIGARAGVQPAGVERLPSTTNYFLGADARQWRSDVPNYAKVRYADVYPGIDLLFHGDDHGNGTRLEYDFELAPRADPRLLRIVFQGADRVAVNRDGSLTAGPLHFNKPAAYQNGRPIAVAFTRRGRQVGFRVGEYDRLLPLEIDPTLVYSTYLGGSEYENGLAVAVDSGGNAYVTGYTNSLDFPVQNALQASCVNLPPDGCADIFITKFSPAGALLYSTYLGGSLTDLGTAIAVDSTGAVYITGNTASPDFPLKNPIQPAGPAATHTTSFVAKLSPAGSALIYSTYLGGSGGDYGQGIAVDGGGNAYIAGNTGSPNFPLVNPIKATISTSPINFHVFVTVINSTGSALLFSTYLGGSGIDEGNAIALDPAGNMYVAGSTDSQDFPLLGSFQSTIGDFDAFVVKISPAYQLVYSTVFGGGHFDAANAIAVDASGAAYVTGETQSPSFPTQNPALPSQPAGGAFLTKLAPSGSSLVYSTYLGLARGFGIAVDASGNAFVTGDTSDFSFPVVNAIQAAKGGIPPAQFGQSGFVSKMSADGSHLVYSTYLGGNYSDRGLGIALNPAGEAYVVGTSLSNDFPAINAFQSGTAVSEKFTATLARISETSTAPCVFVLAPASVTLHGEGDSGAVRVNTNSSTCSWQVTSGVPWLTITQGAGTTGIGNVLFTAAANPGLSPRTTTLSPGGQTLTITQNAPSHVVASASAGAPGGLARVPMTLSVDTPSGYLGLIVNLSVTPNGSAPALTTPLAFQVNPAMPAPQVNTSGGPGTIVLTWLGVLEPNLTTGTVNLGELLATIPSSASVGQSYLVATPGGSGQVTAAVVDTLIPGATVTLSVANPPPVALWTLPSSATPGGAGLTVTVNGQGFTTTSVVLWNGSARTTVFLSETQLQASITAADISAASTAQLTVSNPAPGGGLSGSLPFLISGLAAPVINTSGIVSNAQYTTSLAGNTIASVFGQNLAASTALATSLPLPTTLGGVSVLVDGVAAPLFYVSPLQINLQLPWRLLNQTQTSIVVVSNGLSSAVTTIPLTATAPAIYSLNAQGNGQGAILQANSGTVVAPLNSIPGVVTQPGSPLEFISIFCTGLGAVQTYTFGDGTAATAATTVASTQVTIGGVAATVTYAGLAPSYVGLYQINAVIPTGVPSGSAIPVIVKINGITSNTVTIAIQ